MIREIPFLPDDIHVIFTSAGTTALISDKKS